MTTQPLRVAVLGAGTMGLVCLQALQRTPAFLAVAVADPSPIARRNAQSVVPTLKTYFSPTSLISAESLDSLDIDMVVVMTPPANHARFVCAALAAGRHTLCEKPMAISVQEVRQMVTAATDAPKSTAIVGHQLRYNIARQWVRSKLAEGIVGEPRHVSVVQHFPNLFVSNWTWWSSLEQGGGLLYEYGSHLIDILQWWFGPAMGASGTTRTVVDNRFDVDGILQDVTSDDLSLLHLQWSSGLVADIQLSGVASLPRRDIAIHGDEGSIVLDRFDQVAIVSRRTGLEEVFDLREPEPSLIGDPNDSYTQPHRRMLEDLADRIRHGSTPELACSFVEGAQVIELINQVRPIAPVGEST